MPDAVAHSISSSKAPPASPSASGDAPRDRILFHLGPLAVTPRLVVRTLLVAAVVGALAFLWSRLDIDDLHARAKALPAIGVIAVIAFAPLVGFPVSWLHLIAGVRFDFLGGIAVVAVTSVLHHVLGWALVRVLPARFFKRLDPWRDKLRGAGHRDATLLCCLLPGMPYAVQLYLMPVLGTPFPLMFGLSAALHTARAVVTILFGDISDELTPPRIAGLVAYYVVLFAVSALALRRLRHTLTMNNTDPARLDPAHIADRARSLWQLAACPTGRDLDFWLQAEAELKKEGTQVAEQAPDHPSETAAPAPPDAPKGNPRRAR
ncbi:MAG: DUF2934 domain-containing protein [Burkholderiales bacterium]|nr:DUF2934 domain-containing protein [Opitutaceae bacterium]